MPPCPLRILVVDDNRDIAKSLADYLTLCGFDTRFACSGEEAVQVVAGFSPDAVILDFALPGIDGYETARRLCAILKRKPLLVMVTGRPDLEGRSHQEGFDHHFQKPVSPSAFTDLIRRHAESLDGGQ